MQGQAVFLRSPDNTGVGRGSGDQDPALYILVKKRTDALFQIRALPVCADGEGMIPAAV